MSIKEPPIKRTGLKYIDKRVASVVLAIIIVIPAIFFISASFLNKRVAEKKVLAFYYSWYGNTTEYDGESSSFGPYWLHWDENHHNPPNTLGSNHTPVLGPYDSADNVTIGQHLAWARQSGIDGFISTWWGQGSHDDIKFAKYLRYTQENAIPFEWSVYFESVQQRYETNGSEIYREMKYVCENYGSHPNFLKIDGRPVIFVYAISANEFMAWEEAVRLLHEDGHNPYLVADLGGAEAPTRAELSVFDGFHIYNPAGYLRDQKDYRPDYNKMIYSSHQVGALACYTVCPGYNDFNVCHCNETEGRNTYFEIDRRNGDLYREMWAAARASSADWILICTFNEWHEGSEIEPSVEYGTLYLSITQENTKLWKT